MGCNNSKIDNEEGVARCKQRKRVMRDVVASRHNFAASHVLFIKSLGEVGVAFRVFAEGETTKDHIMYSEVSTPRTPTLSLGPPPPATLHPPPPFSPGFSPSPPPHSPLSPHVKLSALRLQNGSPITRAVSSPESFAQEFFPPPPPPVALKEHRMEHTPSASVTNIYRFNEGSSNSYKSYRLEGSPPPPPFQPIQMDDDWKYSGRRAPPSNASRENNPPPPPPVTRSSWQDLFMDPFRPSPPVFNYMEERRNQDVVSKQSQEIEEQKRRQESERKRNHEAEHRRMKEAEQGRKHDIEQRIHEERKKAHEMEERRNRELEQRRREESPARPPPVRIVEVKPKNFVDDIPDLEEDDIPELEDVDEDIDWPPPEDVANGKNNHAVKKPQSAPEPSPKRAPEPSPKPAPRPSPEPIPEPSPKPAPELSPEPTPEKIPEPAPKPAAPEPAASEPAASEPALPKSVSEPVPDPKTPPKTPPQTPPKVQEPPPKSAKAGKPAKTPGKPPKPEHSIAKTNKELAVSKAEKGGRDLLEVLKEVDECFIRAVESGEIVSTLLDTKKTHYHSSFSDSLRGVGESARMNLLRLSGKSGSSSFRTTSNMSSLSNTSVLMDESPSIMSIRRSISNLSSARFAEECGPPTHASTLDKLFAWEKKLYLEVKEAEAVRVELERKFYLYRNQDAKNEDPAVIDKTRSSIKTLQTRMAVAVHAVESAAQQVQRLRDLELYPQLVDLLDGLGTMWKNMSQAHQAQLRAVETMRRLDNSAACEPTTSFHRQATVNLEQALIKWSEGVSRFVNSHKEYLKNLTLWLKLTLQQSSNDEGDSRSGSRSPLRSPRSPSSEGMIGSSIYDLCQRWEDSLAQLPHQVVLEGIGSFASVVREMLRLQWEELRIKKKVDNYQKEQERRELALHTVASKDPGPGFHDGGRSQALTLRSPTTTSGSDADDGRFDMVVSSGFSERSEVAEKRLKFEAARRKLEAELEAERKAYTDTRAFTLNSLQSGLPQLFQAVTAFANSEADMYDQLSTTHSLLNK